MSENPIRVAEGDEKYVELKRYWLNEGCPPRFTYAGGYWEAVRNNDVIVFVYIGSTLNLYSGVSWKA